MNAIRHLGENRGAEPAEGTEDTLEAHHRRCRLLIKVRLKHMTSCVEPGAMGAVGSGVRVCWPPGGAEDDEACSIPMPLSLLPQSHLSDLFD